MNLQIFFNGLVTGCIYALIAIGFSLIYNTTRVFHFAHGVVYTVTAYFFYTFLRIWGIPFFLSVVFAIGLCAFLGILIEILVYQPLSKRDSPLAVSIISSLGVYIFLVNLIAMIFGNEIKIIQSGIEKTYNFAGVLLTRIQIIQIVVFLILFPLIYLFMKHTRIGNMMRALSNNPQLATVIGIPVKQVRILIFGIGSALAGIAAILNALDVGIDPQAGFTIIFIAAVAVIIGGVEFFEGAVLGAFFLGFIQNFIVWNFSARWQEVFTFLILILFLLFRPQGILGIKKRVEEIRS